MYVLLTSAGGSPLKYYDTFRLEGKLNLEHIASYRTSIGGGDVVEVHEYEIVLCTYHLCQYEFDDSIIYLHPRALIIHWCYGLNRVEDRLHGA